MKISHLLEALPISTAKTYVKAWNPNFHKEVFERQPRKDKNAYRIYIPFELETQKQVIIPATLTTYLQTAIPNKPYATDVENYMQGLAFEVANPTRKLGIGKMLARSESGEKDPVRKSELQSIKKAFDADPQRAATKTTGKLIVISRHPYDVAGMSTDRGWKSCMNLVDGENKHYVLRDVKQGSIVAYLINSDDVNVRKPLARILIKPYQEKGNPKNLAMMGDIVYGTAPESFKSQVDAWINKNYNHNKSGLFCLAPGLYQDDIPSNIRLLNDEDFKSATPARIVSMGDDESIWPRIAALRPDADDIFIQIAEKSDVRAAKWIKQIDVAKLTKMIIKKPWLLRYLHTQPPELVNAALKLSSDNVIYVRNRTPEQHGLVNKIIKRDAYIIQEVTAPTHEQIQLAIKVVPSLVYWVKNKYPNQLSDTQIKHWFISVAKDNELHDSDMNWIKENHPKLLKEPDVIKTLGEHEPKLLWSHVQLNDQEVQELIMRAPAPSRYDWNENFLESHVAKLASRLKKIPIDQLDPKLIPAITRKIPDLLGAFEHLELNQLLPLVKNKPGMIAHWNNPAPELVYAAMSAPYDDDQHPNLVGKFESEQYMPMWEKLIKKDPENLFMMKHPSEKLQNLAAMHPKIDEYDSRQILRKFNPSVATQVRILKNHPVLIKYISKPKLALQLAAVHADPDVYIMIKPKDRHPSTKAYMAAYRKEMRKPE